jgi:hypothetical protein
MCNSDTALLLLTHTNVDASHFAIMFLYFFPHSAYTYSRALCNSDTALLLLTDVDVYHFAIIISKKKTERTLSSSVCATAIRRYLLPTNTNVHASHFAIISFFIHYHMYNSDTASIHMLLLTHDVDVSHFAIIFP